MNGNVIVSDAFVDICKRCVLPKDTCKGCSFGNNSAAGLPTRAEVDFIGGKYHIDILDCDNKGYISLQACDGNHELVYAVAELINRGIKSMRKDIDNETV